MKTNAPTDLLPPPIVTGLLEGNLLPADMLTEQLPVLAPRWDGEPNETNTHTLKILWGTDPAAIVTFTSATAPNPDSARTLRVPIRFFEEGTFEVRYSVTIIQDAPDPPLELTSHSITIVIDTSVPELGDPNELVFDPKLFQDGITEAYLAANGDKIVAEVPAYTRPQIGDVITAYWDAQNDDDTVMVQRVLNSNDYQEPISLDIPGASIRQHGTGTWKVRYEVKDRAGNPSGFSRYVSLEVKEDAPSDLMDPPLFHDRDIADRNDNTLYAVVITAEQGLEVLIPPWKNQALPGLKDTLWLEYTRKENPADADYEATPVVEIVGPIPPESFPIPFTLPDVALRPDGPFKLRYAVQGWNGGKARSEVVTLIADTAPPFKGTEPPPLTAPDVAITDDYLDAHPEGVTCTLEAYDDFQPGDRITYWWVGEERPEEPSDLEPAGRAIITELPFDVIVPAQVVREAGDGGCAIVYVLFDKALNRSRLSVWRDVAVALGMLPADLKDPLVQQAEDGQIDLADVLEGVLVRIPKFENLKATDRIEVTWGDTVLEPEEFGSAPDWPVPILVPTETVQAEYGDAVDAKSTHVSYRILRGAVGSEAKAISTDVNLSYIGPVLPDWPNLNNPNLEKAKVFGKVSGLLDELTPEDTGEDVRVDIALYDPVNENELIDVYWGGVLVPDAQYIIQAGDTPGRVVSVTVPWSFVEQAGNAAQVPVEYRIYGPGSPNQQISPTTHVKVAAVVVTPEAPTFLNLSPEGWLNCFSLDGADHAVLVQVPDLSQYLAEGDQVTLTWTPLAKLDGEDVLTDAIKVEPITLDAAHKPTGFVWRVQPFEDHIAPTHDPDGPGGPAGRARIHYAFDYQGQPATSDVTEARVGMFTGAGECSLNFGEEEG
ncbi:hypothetical protein ACGFZ3_12385 [Stenotrophomonas sp. NPDC047960]|uniref:hypothetical protein n=1 Tax=Stenotrophomonas sp. NPDC047960 TaxID=3364531 RepID=UPI00371E618F